MPGEIAELGKLRELRVSSAPHRGGDKFVIRFDDDGPRECLLSFDTTKAERLYLSLTPAAREEAKASLIDPNGEWVRIEDVAAHAGGRQAQYEDRSLWVQPLGYATHVVYFTEKKGDGPSEYIHHMGEEGGTPPILCVDAVGELYFAGGSYTVKAAGITR